MNIVQQLQSWSAARFPPRLKLGWKLKIGPRLLVGFLITILLTGLIGFLAVQQLGRLSAAMDELNNRDLPEVITNEHLRSLVYRQRDLERRVVNPNNPNMSADQATLETTLNEIARDRATLLSFGPPDSVTQINSYQITQQLSTNLTQSSANSQRILALVKANQFTQAQALVQNQQSVLMQALFTQTLQLRQLEQKEATTSAANVQQQSDQLSQLILALLLFSVPLSATLALLITRSLTRPLAALLNATQAMSDGDLEVDPQVAPGDELGQLGATFNDMRLKLRSTIATLAYERQQTRAVIEASADGMMLVDAQRKILKFNPAAERLSGWSRDEAIGHTCWEVLGCHGSTPEQAEEHERVCPLHLALQSNTEQSSMEMSVYTRDGRKRWYALSSAPVPQTDDLTEPTLLVVGIHDITQLKAVEQLKSDFVAMVSHELRAPLTTVTASVETLGLLDPVGDQESYREVVDILSHQTGRLRRVVEEVLQLARVDAGRLQVHLQAVPLRQFLEEQLEHMRESWVGDDRPLSLTVTGNTAIDGMVWADGSALEIVVRNLLDNARKYSPSGSPIEMMIETPQEADSMQVRISDYGPGIPPEQLDLIFQSFSRGGYSSYNWTRGYGLGLYIAREILRAHNGKIWAENRPEGGASFVFTLCSVAGDSLPAAAGSNAVERERFVTYDYDDSDD